MLKSGVYTRENVNSAKILLIYNKICSELLSETHFENLCAKTSKLGVLIRAGGWKNFQTLLSGGEDGKKALKSRGVPAREDTYPGSLINEVPQLPSY